MGGRIDEMTIGNTAPDNWLSSCTCTITITLMMIMLITSTSRPSHTDRKRPDSMSLISCQADRPAAWDVMVTCNTAASYDESSVCKADAAVKIAATCKTSEYFNLSTQYPVTVETQR